MRNLLNVLMYVVFAVYAVFTPTIWGITRNILIGLYSPWLSFSLSTVAEGMALMVCFMLAVALGIIQAKVIQWTEKKFS